MSSKFDMSAGEAVLACMLYQGLGKRTISLRLLWSKCYIKDSRRRKGRYELLYRF